MLITEREVRAVAGDAVDTDAFPRPVQHGPAGRKWDKDTVEAWVAKKTVRRPKGEGESVDTRPVD